MAQRGQKTPLEERVEIGERWEAGQTDPEIAAAMGRSVWSVCDCLLDRAQQVDCTPVNRAFIPTRANAPVLTTKD